MQPGIGIELTQHDSFVDPLWRPKPGGFSRRQKIGEPAAAELPDLIDGPSRTRTLDPLIKRHRPNITPKHSDALKPQQLELWPSA
jgi:hypothetical protein